MNQQSASQPTSPVAAACNAPGLGTPQRVSPIPPDGFDPSNRIEARAWIRNRIRLAVEATYRKQDCDALEILLEAEHALRCLVLSQRAGMDGIIGRPHHD